MSAAGKDRPASSDMPRTRRWSRLPSHCRDGCSPPICAPVRPRELSTPGPVVDPRLSPDGRHIAYVVGRCPARHRERTVRATACWPLPKRTASPTDWRSSSPPRRCSAAAASGGPPTATGCSWPASTRRPCGGGGSPTRRTRSRSRPRWRIRRPVRPTPRSRLHCSAPTATERRRIEWDRDAPSVSRPRRTGPRAGRRCCSYSHVTSARSSTSAVDPGTGTTSTLHAEQDPDWLELFAGVPAWTPDGRLVRIEDEGGARVLMVGDRALHIRGAARTGGARRQRGRHPLLRLSGVGRRGRQATAGESATSASTSRARNGRLLHGR